MYAIINNMESIYRTQVFGKATGRANNYRIPSVITTKHGTVVACADERFFSAADFPNRIDKVVRRSEDGGRTWQEQIVAVEEVGESKNHGSLAIDPALLYDEEQDKIFMLYSHTPTNIGIITAKRGTGLTSKGDRKVTVDGKKGYIDANGKVFAGKSATSYTVDERGYVYEGGKKIGNMYIKDCPVCEYETFFLYICESSDDGKTWSKPVCLNSQVKQEWMSFLGTCPGIGIKLKHGKYAGRLIFPVYYNSQGMCIVPILSLSACVIYSDDGGKTWKRGKSPNDGRKKHGIKLSSRFVADWNNITESQVIELPDGTLRMFMRNHSLKRLISMAESTDGGVTWHNYRHNEYLPQPICQVSVLNAEHNGKQVTLVCNAADKQKRINGLVRLSYDYGETFVASMPVKQPDEDNGFVYSCMTQAANGDIVLLYEGSTKHETIESIVFPVSALENYKNGKIE